MSPFQGLKWYGFIFTGLKLISISSLLKKRRAIREPLFFQLSPSLIELERWELKGVSEN